MIFLQILGQAYALGFSGAMMPGPLLTYDIQLSLKKGFWIGPKIILGHAILEACLILGLSLGLGKLLQLEITQIIIGLAGGLMLAWMGYGMLRFESKAVIALDTQAATASETRLSTNLNPVAAGIVISLMNPYFLFWWTVIGLALIMKSLSFGWGGLICFYVGHILADLTWYSLVSFAVSGGRKIITPQIYRWLLIGCGIFLIYLAGQFIYDALKSMNVWQLFFNQAIDLFKGFQRFV